MLSSQVCAKCWTGKLKKNEPYCGAGREIQCSISEGSSYWNCCGYNQELTLRADDNPPEPCQYKLEHAIYSSMTNIHLKTDDNVV
jgi:hypothetical protein